MLVKLQDSKTHQNQCASHQRQIHHGHTVAIDFKGPVPSTSEYLLVVTDVYSKYPEVEVVRSTEAKTVIPQLDKIFARHGIPAKITTDNDGPPFNVAPQAIWRDALLADLLLVMA